ncbi:MAG: CPBP family intramembrane metalloprotease [Bacteroidales bacterium]|jgi:membrane protease YdiL (CAAX protease family)|nr:CPBP family intramembrane metalloprotease [Bacteroidales bacterium]
MKKGLFESSTPLSQLILSLAVMVTSVLLLSFIGILFAPLVAGISFPDFVTRLGDGSINSHLPFMRYLQTIQSISLFIIPAFLLGYLFSGNIAKYFTLKQAIPLKWFVFVFLLMVSIVPVINLLVLLNEIMIPAGFTWIHDREAAAEQLTRLFLHTDTAGGLLFNIFMIGMLPALGEELIFRGIIQKIFTRWTGNTHAAIIISGFLFSAMHFQFYGLIPRWLLGVLFGYLLVWSGSIWLPVFAHFVNNTMAVIVAYFSYRLDLPEDIADYGAAVDALPVTVALTAVCALLLWKVKRECGIFYRPVNQ